MRYLLDTCTFLWVLKDDPALSPAAREAFRAGDSDVYLSVVSAWEIAVKHGLGRLPLPEPPSRYVPRTREAHGIESLELDEAAVSMLDRLPPLHRDPFDRMLVCQALARGCTLVTPDGVIANYPVPTLW